MKYIVTKKCYANEFVSVIAESEEEARKIAQERLNIGEVQCDSQCYDIEVEAQE